MDAPASDEQVSPGMCVMFVGRRGDTTMFHKAWCLVLSLVIYYLRVIKWLTVLDSFLGWDLEFH